MGNQAKGIVVGIMSRGLKGSSGGVGLMGPKATTVGSMVRASGIGLGAKVMASGVV